MKKIIKLFIFVLLLVAAGFSASAEESNGYLVTPVRFYPSADEGSVTLFTDNNVSVYDYLYEALLERELTNVKFKIDSEGNTAEYGCVDVSAYGLALDDFDNIIRNLSISHPELMLLTAQYGYSLKSDGTVRYLIPYYIFESKQKSDTQRDAMIAWMNSIADEVPEDISDVEKLLCIYRSIANNVTYSPDTEIVSTSPKIYSDVCYTAYSGYINGHFVCQGYVSLMKYVLERLGIECGLVYSLEVGHIWNYVKIDGEYYHIDITWDDDDASLRDVIYMSFLLSDAGKEADIRSRYTLDSDVQLWAFYDDGIVCDNDKYESGYIWNWNYLADIESCERGFKGSVVYGNVEFAVPYTFRTLELPGDEIIISWVVDGYIVVNCNNCDTNKNAEIYIAGLTEEGDMTDIVKALAFETVTYNHTVMYSVHCPEADIYNVMCVEKGTYAPLAYNVMMTE